MQKKTEQLINDVAKKHNIDPLVVKSVFESQFHCAKQEIKKATAGEPDTFPVIRFRHLGVLTPKTLQIIKIHEQATKNSTSNESD